MFVSHAWFYSSTTLLNRRKVTWSHIFAGIGGIFYPSANSWDQAVDPVAAGFNTQLAPYATLECEIHVWDMSVYREVSVTFYITSVIS